MVKNDNGYSFQPDLFNKMYEDKKESNAKKEKEKKRKEKKKEREKKEKERKNKNKKKKKRKMTRNEKIIYTILLVIAIPLGVLFFIYYNSSLMQTILLAKGLYKTEKNLGLPTDSEKVPYTKSNTPSAENDPSNSKSIFDIMDKQNKTVAGVQPPKKQTGGKRKIQRGGNKFNKTLNDAKGFLDPTKFGFPYMWYDNDNLVMRGVSDYFITFWTFMRGGLVKLLDMCHETLYKDYQGHPSDLGGQVFDFIKFTAILPMLTTLIYVGNYAMGSAALVWSSINNQTLLILFWLTVGISLIVSGTIALIATGGITFFFSNIFATIAAILIFIPLCYFFPYGFFWFYLQALILKITDGKKKLFRNYLKNYELCWILTIVSLMGTSISYLWDWHIIPLVAFGGVGGTFVLLRAMGLI
tara:strand:- start:11943 stop:13178 length:1236 start_codon:yes stop_codon:yes gene_type:complete